MLFYISLLYQLSSILHSLLFECCTLVKKCRRANLIKFRELNWVECEYLLNIRICRCYQDLRLSVKKIFGLFLLRELQMNKTPSILNCIYYCNNNKICRSAFNTHSFLRNHKLGRYLIKLLRMDPVQNITHSILSSSKLCKSNNITTSGFLGFLFNFATYSINFQQMFTHFPDSLLHIYVHII